MINENDVTGLTTRHDGTPVISKCRMPAQQTQSQSHQPQPQEDESEFLNLLEILLPGWRSRNPLDPESVLDTPFK